MDFLNLNSQSLLGKLIRLPFRLLPKNTIMPIMQGRLKGKKWIIGAGSHAYWTGTYEYKKRIIFEKYVEKGMIVYDIGANVGYYSMLASQLVMPTGIVYAFEPFKRNIEFIKQHITVNNLTNIEIFEVAVSDHSGKGFFDPSFSIATGRLSKNGDLEVDLISLDELLIEHDLIPPNIIKIDVEGGEFDVINGAKYLIEKHHPVIFLETHGRDIHEKTINLLRKFGYKFEVLEEHPEPFRQELIAIF